MHSPDVELIAALERQQRLLGEELHDTLCQTLASSSLLVNLIDRSVEAEKPVARETWRKLKNVLERTLSETQALSSRYNPVSLEGAGLMNALAKLAGEKPGCDFNCKKAVFIHNAAVALAVFRIAEEALRWSASCISLDRDEQEVTFEVICAPDLPTIALLEKRARAAGGTIQTEASGLNAKDRNEVRVVLKEPHVAECSAATL